MLACTVSSFPPLRLVWKTAKLLVGRDSSVSKRPLHRPASLPADQPTDYLASNSGVPGLQAEAHHMRSEAAAAATACAEARAAAERQRVRTAAAEGAAAAAETCRWA